MIGLYSCLEKAVSNRAISSTILAEYVVSECCALTSSCGEALGTWF